MKAIYIPQLIKEPEQTESIEVNQFLATLETLTPIQGRIKVMHRGNYLEVSVQAETIITLACDRCLQQYNHRLATTATELIWLDEAVDQPAREPLELEVAPEDLVEILPLQGNFYPDTWLYEQLCLAIPQRQLCDQQCSGIAPVADLGAPLVRVDRRWAALEALKQNYTF